MSTLQTTILKHPDSGSNNIQFDSSGNVGINDAAPSEKLNVGGNIMLEGANQYLYLTNQGVGNSGIYVRGIQSTDNGTLRNHTTGVFTWEVTGNEKARLTSEGTLVIGRQASSDPNRYVQIHNATAASSAYLQSTNTGTGSGAADGIVMGMGDATNAYFWNYEAGSIIFATSASQKAAIDPDGRLLVGTTQARNTFYGATSIEPQFQIESAGAVDDNRMMSIVSNPGDTGGYAATILLGRSRSGVANGVGALGENDPLGQISFQGADSAKLLEGANIAAFCDAAVQAAGEMPGRLVFSTTADGESSPTERVRIHNTGYVNWGNHQSTDQHRINGVNNTQGTPVLTVSAFQGSNGTSQDTAIFMGVNASGSANAAATAIKIYRNDTTLRSINAAGTVNTSGNDYAEYMTKAGDFTIAKGDICGINAQGKLTNVFADAVTFVVKSTDPSYVGGDTWDIAAGKEPGGLDDTRTGEELEAAKVAYQEQLEVVRQTVDRIAFSGQTPVNVTGSAPGQHIIPTANSDGSILGTAKSEENLTLTEYMSSVGKVIAIEGDGRARIIVKVA